MLPSGLRSTPNGIDSPPRWAPRARAPGAVGPAGLVVTIVLLVVTPSAPAAPVPRVHVPPYRHTNVTITSVAYSIGNCRNVSVVRSTHWLPATGEVTTYAYATAGSCPGTSAASGTGRAVAAPTVFVAIPVPISSGRHNVSVTVAYSLSLTASLLGTFRCPRAPMVRGHQSHNDCNALANTLVEWTMTLEDTTNNTSLSSSSDYVLGPTNWTYVDNYSVCNGAGTCGWFNSSVSCVPLGGLFCARAGTHLTGNNTTWINTGRNCAYSIGSRCFSGGGNWTLNASHRYRVAVQFTVFATASLVGYLRGATALATVNAATLGNLGWKIASITVH